jgi:hypothetical protein
MNKDTLSPGYIISQIFGQRRVPTPNSGDSVSAYIGIISQTGDIVFRQGNNSIFSTTRYVWPSHNCNIEVVYYIFGFHSIIAICEVNYAFQCLCQTYMYVYVDAFFVRVGYNPIVIFRG